MPVRCRFQFFIFTLLALACSASAVAAPTGSLSEEQRRVRLHHAKELLGSTYSHSVAKSGEGVKKINSAVYAWVKEHLPAKNKKQYQAIAQAVIDESLRNEFDPVFLLSVIQSESSFNPDAKGSAGEIGMMQLMPSTAEWMAKQADVKWIGKDTLRDPIANIKIGAVYLSHLRGQFDSHARLYLAAYNMGGRKVREIREKKLWLKDYPKLVMRRYVDFYSSLKAHLEAKLERPRLAAAPVPVPAPAPRLALSEKMTDR